MKRSAKKLLLSLAGWLSMSVGHAQNLVPNSGFENGSCVVNYNSTPQKIPTTISNWYSASGASPDPFDVCGTAMPAAYKIVAPDILMGYQYAHSGNRFMGFGFYGAPWYEYIGTKLTTPLEAGETYHVSFWLSCADMMSWAADQVGIYFSTTEISYPSTSTSGLLNYTPQVVNPVGNFITDTTWQQVSGDFVAAGGEQWIVIGYFKQAIAADFYHFPETVPGQASKANPNYRVGVAGTGGSGRAYYYIDDVSVEKQTSSLPIRLTAFAARAIDKQVKLSWNTETESNNCRFEIERSDNGAGFHKIGAVAGAINSSATLHYQFMDAGPVPGLTYYRIKQVDCDGKSSYSKTVSVDVTLSTIYVYPNPAVDQLTISRTGAGLAKATVYDFMGRELAVHRITEARQKISVVSLLPGNYIIKVVDDKGTFSRTFTKK